MAFEIHYIRETSCAELAEWTGTCRSTAYIPIVRMALISPAHVLYVRENNKDFPIVQPNIQSNVSRLSRVAINWYISIINTNSYFNLVFKQTKAVSFFFVQPFYTVHRQGSWSASSEVVQHVVRFNWTLNTGGYASRNNCQLFLSICTCNCTNTSYYGIWWKEAQNES